MSNIKPSKGGDDSSDDEKEDKKKKKSKAEPVANSGSQKLVNDLLDNVKKEVSKISGGAPKKEEAKKVDAKATPPAAIIEVSSKEKDV